MNVNDCSLECSRIYNPPNGKITCDSRNYAEGTTCSLKCDHGFISQYYVKTTCIFDYILQNHTWTVDPSELVCIEGMAFVIGGMLPNHK